MTTLSGNRLPTSRAIELTHCRLRSVHAPGSGSKAVHTGQRHPDGARLVATVGRDGQGDHRLGDVDSDHCVEPASQGVSEPAHATSEVERAPASRRNAEARQLGEEVLHLRPARGEELLRIPLPSGLVVLAENRPERVAAGVVLPDARHFREPLCRRGCVGVRRVLLNRHVVQMISDIKAPGDLPGLPEG